MVSNDQGGLCGVGDEQEGSFYCYGDLGKGEGLYSLSGLGRLCAAHPGAATTFPCDDPAALDAAIERLAADHALKEAQILAGKAAAAKYDWRELSTKLVGFYAQV